MAKALPGDPLVRGFDLSDGDFSGQDLSGRSFVDCSFAGCSFRGADLRDASFEKCEFNDPASARPTDFSHAQLRGCQFLRCNLTVAELLHCRAYDVVFEHCQMQGADLSHMNCRLPVGDTNLAAFTMRRCNFAFGNLSNGYLAGCTLTGNRMIEACLDYCDLTEADLSECELHNISAVGLVLKGADLRGSTFNNINPRDIDLSGVRLRPAEAALLLDALGIELDTQ